MKGAPGGATATSPQHIVAKYTPKSADPQTALIELARTLKAIRELKNPSTVSAPVVAARPLSEGEQWGRLLDPSRPEQSAHLVMRQILASSGSVTGLAPKLSTSQHLSIVPHLEEPYRSRVRDEVLQLVLKSLTSTSDNHVNAAAMLSELVNLQLVLLTGVASTLEALLQDPSTRKAACAVLAKLSQQSQSPNHPTRTALKHLSPLVARIDDPDLEYDVVYVNRAMQWKAPRATLTHGKALSTPHKGAIISSAFFPQRDELVTGGADGLVCVWGAPNFGEAPSASFSLPASSIPCSMDASVRGNLLAVAVASLDGKAPQIHLYPVIDLGKWGAAQKVNRPIGSAITAVKCLGNRSAAFCASERTAKGTHSLVFFGQTYDSVVRDISDAHVDYVTCLATSMENDAMILSGSRDKTVKLWDTRASKAQSSHLIHHSAAVTSVSTVRDLVATGALDRSVCVWDVRKLQRPIAEKSLSAPVLRVCCGLQTTAVVATTNSISALTLDPLEVQDITPNVCYHELRQNMETSVVFAAGEGGVIDLYSLKVSTP